jgi:NADPH:quinone reductase-like Zn-dependent oxidoreductase
MRAVLSKAPGGPETLVVEEVLDPRPMKGEVVIEVRAVGVNFPDTLIIEDRYQFKPTRPFSPGGEVAGVVEAVGEGGDHGPQGRPGHRRARLGRDGRAAGGACRLGDEDP